MVEIFLKFYFRSLPRGGMGWEEWDDWDDWDFWERWEEWEDWEGGRLGGPGKRKQPAAMRRQAVSVYPESSVTGLRPT